ncbi:MAG: alpha/beta hydrolase [Chloroflexi bacterium]|nr:alpha/beta hydrolase [Chloroflexota bacterium]
MTDQPAVFYRCRGYGSPTVVMDAGLGDTSRTWGAVEPEVARFTRVFVYDRKGIGASQSGSRPRNSRQMVSELRDLLSIAGIAPPYVLVGHSFGGLNMILFASLHPDEAKGLVLVDTPHPNRIAAERKLLSPEQMRRYIDSFNGNSEGMTLEEREESSEQVSAAPPLPDIPLVVLHSGTFTRPAGWPVRALEQSFIEGQKDLASRTPQGKRVVVEGRGHYIQHDHPELVIEAISEVVERARAAERLEEGKQR